MKRIQKIQQKYKKCPQKKIIIQQISKRLNESKKSKNNFKNPKKSKKIKQNPKNSLKPQKIKKKHQKKILRSHFFSQKIPTLFKIILLPKKTLCLLLLGLRNSTRALQSSRTLRKNIWKNL